MISSRILVEACRDFVSSREHYSAQVGQRVVSSFSISRFAYCEEFYGQDEVDVDDSLELRLEDGSCVIIEGIDVEYFWEYVDDYIAEHYS